MFKCGHPCTCARPMQTGRWYLSYQMCLCGRLIDPNYKPEPINKPVVDLCPDRVREIVLETLMANPRLALGDVRDEVSKYGRFDVSIAHFNNKFLRPIRQRLGIPSHLERG